MSLKQNFEHFLSGLGVNARDILLGLSDKDFGDCFFSFARANGYDIANSNERVLQRLNVPIQEVIDVGVHDGTPWLYKCYPEARFVLVEPQRHATTLLKSWPLDYIFLNAAVGDKPGTMLLNEAAERSSLLGRTDSSQQRLARGTTYTVPMVTLDNIITEHCATDNIGVKIDIEGFEYFALQGLSTHAPRVKFIILEVSIRNRFQGERDLAAIFALLSSKHFRFYNIMNTARPVPPNAYDMIWLQSDSIHFDIEASQGTSTLR